MPTYKVVSDLGTLNSYAGLILPITVSATTVFFFLQFFKSVPREIAEAAAIDGATPMRFHLAPAPRMGFAAEDRRQGHGRFHFSPRVPGAYATPSAV